VGQFLHQLSLVQNSRSIQPCRQSHVQNNFSSLTFSGRNSLCFTDQGTQEENVLGGPTPFWVRSYTGYVLYKFQDLIIACRQSSGRAKTFFLLLRFRKDQSLLYRPRNSGRERARWTNSLVVQFLH